MSIRQAVKDLEKRLTGCSRIRVFEYPMAEKEQIHMPVLKRLENRGHRIKGKTAIQVLQTWTDLMNHSFLKKETTNGQT